MKNNNSNNNSRGPNAAAKNRHDGGNSNQSSPRKQHYQSAQNSATTTSATITQPSSQSSASASSHPSSQANSQQQQQQQQQQPYQQKQYQQKHHFQRDRSGQRNQHPDSSMMSNRGGASNVSGSDNPHISASANSLSASQKFQPGFPTKELPPIETKADPNKKFTGRCRLFVGNLPHNTSEEKLRTLFENYGEVGEVFLGPKSAFAFIKMDTRQNAESARDALDCKNYENRTLRVRLAAHAAAIRVKHLSPVVTNELLAYAFRYFGEIERAVVVVDDKGKSIGEGIIEYSRKQSALYAIKRCQQECFLLTSSPKPVLVEAFDQQDEDEGLPEKALNKNTNEWREQREVGPRFAEQGSFEHSFASRWKDLYDLEKQKRDRLEEEIQEARKNLQDQIEYSRMEHDEVELRNRLQQLEDNRLKLQQMKEQNLTDAQQREELRRQQDMLIRQREENVLRRQQFGDDPNVIIQQENTLRMQSDALRDLLNHQERNNNNKTLTDLNEDSNNQRSHSSNQASGPAGQADSESAGMSMPFQLNNQPRSFSDVAMMGQQQQQQQQQQQSYLSSVQQQMGMQVPTTQNSQLGQPSIFTTYLPAQATQQTHPISVTMDGTPIGVYPPPLSGYPLQAMSQQTSSVSGSGGVGLGSRQSKYSRQYNNQSNNINITPHSGNGRPRKRGRF